MSEGRLIGRTLLHYQVLDRIGFGGMGEVYLAEDRKLGRQVALKVLPSETAPEQDRVARSRRETEAIATLSHPNIVTTFSVEEAEGVRFLTMELVDGQPLSEVMAAGVLAPERVLEIALSLSEALAAAHAKGITHRDITPRNVMVTTDGRIKVLDFGSARMVPPPSPAGGLSGTGRHVWGAIDSERATEPQSRDGTVVGTAPYMSPEQITGRPVGPQSDIFSLGIVLFEMAAGRRPFEGDSAIELFSAILKDEPPDLGELRPELSGRLARTIRRCLVKDPQGRYRDGAELLHELRGGPRTKPDPADSSLAR